MKLRLFVVSPLVLVLLAGCAVDDASQAATDRAILAVEGGTISGAPTGDDEEIWVYKGIPFAAPPVGDLRWRPPQPVDPWEGIRSATAFSPRCVQRRRSGRPSPNPDDPGMSEDCLYLNVWTGASAQERRPVMVWIHGGGLRTGSGSVRSYDGEALARRGVVLVTINYRLGPFGYFAHPLLTEEAGPHSSGNYGILDQIAALEWVQEHIAAFGGDPNRVTIFGESAGSWSVHYLVATPLAARLFHRAIGESGGGFGTMAAPLVSETAEESGRRLAAALMGGESEVSLETLRATTSEELMQALESEQGPFRPRPTVDGWVFPDTIYNIFAAGNQNAVPVIVGSNADEGSLARSRAPDDVGTYVERTREQYGALSDKFLETYPAQDGEEAREAFLRAFADRNFGWEMRTWARMMETTASPAYLYFFSRVPPGSERGAYHAAEIRYVFGNLEGGRHAYEEMDHRISDLMSSYWVNFATTGDPNGEGLPAWPVYTAEADQVMEFGDSQKVQTGIRKVGLDFFDRFFASMRSGSGGT